MALLLARAAMPQPAFAQPGGATAVHTSSAAGLQPAFAQPADATAPAGWGPIPAPSDSSTAVVEDRGMPLWEHAIVWPYRVVTFPARLAVEGIGQAVTYLDEHYVIQRIETLLAPPVVPFGFDAEVDVGGIGGPGAGLTFYHNQFPGRGNRFRIGFASSVHGSQKAHAGIQVGRFESGLGYRVRQGERFFGIGPDALEENESLYTQEVTWGGLVYEFPLPGRSGVSATAIYSAAGARGSKARYEPGLADLFADDRPAGYRERSDGISLGLELHTAPVEETGRPESGTLARARAVYFAGTNGSSPDFWTYRGEIQQFVPLWFSYRALALRGVLSWIDPAGQAEVPFQRLLTNDDPDLFRGYEDLRWRDRGLALFTAEYRWPIWAPRDGHGPGVDAYILTDVGQVFGKFSEIGGGNLTTSWGGGLRLVGGRGFAARVEAAGGEELQIRFAASQVFQHGGSGLLRGQSPVPER